MHGDPTTLGRADQRATQANRGELILEPLEELAHARAQWNGLAAKAGNIFMTWEWAEAWVRHLNNEGQLEVAIVRQRDGLSRVLLPLYVARRQPARLVRFIGAGPGDELGPICAPEDQHLAAEVLRERADTLLDGSGVLLAERLRADGAVAAGLGGITLRRAGTPTVPIEGRSFDDWLAARSRNFRSQFRRAERRLLREHGLTYRLTDAHSLERDFRILLELHRARWGDGTSSAFAGPRENFHRDFTRRALANGWLRLWTLELDGRPAASWYGLRYGDTDYYYQAGRDPRFSTHKVGFVLLCHTIRSACEDGIAEYRLGLGQEPYKDRFTEVDPGLVTVGIGRGVRGRLAVRAALSALSVRDQMRQLRARAGRQRRSSSQ